MRIAKQKQRQKVTETVEDYRFRRVVLRPGMVLLLAVMTMLMLSLIQEPCGLSRLAWLAIAPWVISTIGALKGIYTGIISFLTGLVYYLVNLYWLIWVTPLGYGGLCFYLAWYFVLSGYILRRVYLRRRWPFTLVLPVVWVSQEYLRAVLFTGFGWFFLGHSQHDSIRLVQICDVFGVYGVTFILAMVNGLICDILLRPLKRKHSSREKILLDTRVLILITAGCVAGALLYGHFRFKQGSETITKGPIASVIQEVIPQYVKDAGESDEEIFTRYLALSEKSLSEEARPELIVWPETMVPGILNREFIYLSQEGLTDTGRDLQDRSRSYDKRLRELAEKGVALLVGAPGLRMDEQGRLSHYNSAFLYQSGGVRYRDHYDKMHLVPFGEVVPFKESWPWLYELLNSLTPYDYEYSLAAGKEPTVFKFTDSQGKQRRFGVAICYEDVTPEVPRCLTVDGESRKRIDFLLNISNDGWFVRGGKSDEPVKASTELIQHLVICKFRAIENRIGIARAVNTGISGFIRPDGVVQGAGLAGGLPAEPSAREAATGFLTDVIYLDSRQSPYSRSIACNIFGLVKFNVRLGDALPIACVFITALVLLITFRKKQAKN